MEVKYKIPYDVYEDYFFDYQGLDADFSLKINKMYSLLERLSVFKFTLLITAFLIILTLLFSWVSNLISFLILKLIDYISTLNINPNLNFLNVDLKSFFVLFFTVIILFFITLIINRIMKFEMPFVLIEMINDRQLIKNNFGKNKHPLMLNRFALLGYLKNDKDIHGLYNFIRGFNKAGSLSDAKKGLKSEYMVENIPLLDGNNNYVPWTFEIINYEKKITLKQKNNIEKNLQILWGCYLDNEYHNIKRRMDKQK